MPKSLVVDPKEVRRSAVLESKDIPLNQYESNPKEEVRKHGKKTLTRLLRDMLLIRELSNTTIVGLPTFR
jgi:hypothetical protein